MAPISWEILFQTAGSAVALVFLTLGIARLQKKRMQAKQSEGLSEMDKELRVETYTLGIRFGVLGGGLLSCVALLSLLHRLV